MTFPTKGHGHCRVLPRAECVVQPCLKVRERGLASDAIRNDFFSFIGQATLVQPFERPKDRFHVTSVHGLVGVAEIDPSSQTSDNRFPLTTEAKDDVSARFVERTDTV